MNQFESDNPVGGRQLVSCDGRGAQPGCLFWPHWKCRRYRLWHGGPIGMFYNFPLLDTISSLILFFPSVVASLKQNFRTSSIIFTCIDFFRGNFLWTMKKISRFLLTKVCTYVTDLLRYIYTTS